MRPLLRRRMRLLWKGRKTALISSFVSYRCFLEKLTENHMQRNMLNAVPSGLFIILRRQCPQVSLSGVLCVETAHGGCHVPHCGVLCMGTAHRGCVCPTLHGVSAASTVMEWIDLLTLVKEKMVT